MVFFAGVFIFRSFSDAPAYRRYAAARRRVGLAMLLLSLNYAVHLFVAPRFSHPEWCILLNICTYFMAAWLFASSMQALLSRDFNSPRRDLLNAVNWVVFSAVSALAVWVSPQGMCDIIVLAVIALVFVLYTLRLALMLIRAHKHAVELLDSYHSDDVAAYIRWMTVFTWLAVFYGVGQGVFTFIPNRYVFLWILSSVPFYCYGYISYTNYLMAVKLVDEAIDDEVSQPLPAEPEVGIDATETVDQLQRTATDPVLESRIGKWIEQGNFTQQGITIVQLAQQIGTNRTYLSAYINRRYCMSFRDWVNSLRLDYAKHLLATMPALTIADIAQRAGYLSQSNFTRLFAASEGMPPGRWKKENCG
jgi:AraC-like DNA-binding protein